MNSNLYDMPADINMYMPQFLVEVKIENSACIYLTRSAVSTLRINDATIAKIHAVSVCGDVGVPLARTIDAVFAHLKALSVSNAISIINDGAGGNFIKLLLSH